MSNRRVRVNGEFTPEWGDIVFRGNGIWKLLKPDSGKVLQSNGANADLSWVAGGGGGGGTWGSITGTLSSQTDLNTALNNRVLTSYLDTDVALTADSDTKLATQKATKAYADGKVANDLTASTVIAPSKSAVNTALGLKADKAITINGLDLSANRTFNQDDILDGTTYKQYSNTEKTKLAGIEALADVTDATNVDSAGATMNTDTTLAGNGYFLDEDNMISDSATKVPSQQSVKAYVDNTVASAKAYKGGYNASTNTPDLDTTPIANIKSGHVYDVTASGTFFTIPVEIGDTLIAEIDNPTLESHWVITQANLTPASIKTQYESNADTNAFTDAQETKLGYISVTQAVDLDAMETAVGASAVDSTVVHLAGAENITGAKSFDDATLILKGSTSGTATLKAIAVAGTTIHTLPDATGKLVSRDSTDTLTNKRVTKRVSTETTNANPSVNSDNFDMHLITALDAPMASFTLSGTPTNGQEFLIAITDDGTPRTLAFGGNFEASAISLPTTTVTSQRLDMRFVWNVASTKWRLISATLAGGAGDVTLAGVQTLTNKRITARTSTEADNLNPSINADSIDYHSITALTGNIASVTLTGTPTEAQKFLISIKGTATRTIAWGASFVDGSAPLPTTTNGTLRLDVMFIWDGVASKWRCMATAGSSPVTQTITDGVTATSPSEDAVFDALSLKAPLASPAFTGTVSTAGNIELGHASDTTLSRVSAGVIAVEGVTVPTISSTNTLTNKRITKRTSTEASNATPSINSDNIDQHSITALAGNLTSFTVTGTPTEGQELAIHITDNGTARTITLGSNFEASEIKLPVTTIISTRLDMRFIWNGATSKWRLVYKSNLYNRKNNTVTQSATPAINTDTTNSAHITGLAQAITSMTSSLTGSPVEGDTLRIDITDDGTARAITWGTSFESSGNVTLPTTTVLSVRLDMAFVWNSVTSKWRIIAVA